MAERHAAVRARISADVAAILELQVAAAAKTASSESDRASGAAVDAGRDASGDDGSALGFDFPAECTRVRRSPLAPPISPVAGQRFAPRDVVNRVVGPPVGEGACVVCVDGGVAVFSLPAGARFVCADVAVAGAALSSLGETFDLIVADPPWSNKSVARGGKYPTLSNDEIERVPVARLCRPGTLVAVWCTNKPAHLAFVRDELFRAWGVHLIAELHWVKLKPDGSLVFPLDSTHKKPYEPLLVACCGGRAAGPSEAELPSAGTFASVASAQHSRKPVLADLLGPLAGRPAGKCKRAAPGEDPGVGGLGPPRCLELFARNLLPGWTSFGNDVLRFQSVDAGGGLTLADECGWCRGRGVTEAGEAAV